QPAGSELIIVPWTGTTLSAQTFGHYLFSSITEMKSETNRNLIDYNDMFSRSVFQLISIYFDK
ncbi:hypothetical protein PL853_08040, partial [Bifidobacterium adolescentis]|uniref:hypothetical protein n=1 Tax=Bifidobacterium adolescentis TaxID=1680 RepID=UPI001E40D20A